MKPLVILLAILAIPSAARAAAYGSLNNFDVVNDTSNRCYGFCIELDDLHSTDVTYTYDYNHYGVPRITEDKTDPAHPQVFVRYEAKRNPDGTFASFTNPQDPLHPLGPTGGHAFTDPSVNLGGEHFGVGNVGTPSLVKYNWLVEDALNPGTLVLGPAVHVATPSFTYVPAAPGVLAQAQVVIVPPAPEVPEINNIPQFGVPVWVKVLKTVQPSGKHVKLDELLPNDPDFPNTNNWAGAEPPQTEVEWQVFQKRPPGNPAGPGEMSAADNLPNGDETVTRRYEFYAYMGSVNPDDGEAQCSDTNNCPDAIGAFIGAQMAGFNVAAPLGLINHLQDGDLLVPYVDRTLVTGGNPPYTLVVTNGAVPDGLSLDSATGVLSGTPTASGTFSFAIQVTDASAVAVTNRYALKIGPSLLPVRLSIQPGSNPFALSWPMDHRGWRLQMQTNNPGAGLSTNWTAVPGSDQTNQFFIPIRPSYGSVFLRLVYP
jgi:hypothetical protein